MFVYVSAETEIGFQSEVAERFYGKIDDLTKDIYLLSKAIKVLGAFSAKPIISLKMVFLREKFPKNF